MTNSRNQSGILDDYNNLMSEIELPQNVKTAVMNEAHAAMQSDPSQKAEAHAASTTRRSAASHHAEPTWHPLPHRMRNRWIGIAACLVLAMGVGAVALTAGPSATQESNDEQEIAIDGAVSPSTLPEGNFFTLTAYADEASQPAEVGTTVELNASGIRPVSYNNAWVDPETGEQANWREFAGMKAGMNASVVGNNVETITYSIEGEDAYLETITDIDPVELPRDEWKPGEPISWSSELTRAKSFTLAYDDVALENNVQLGDVPTILSIYLKVPVPDDVLRNWDTMLNVKGADSAAEEYDAAQNAFYAYETSLGIAGSDVLATCKLTLTATFTDGSMQTKTYAIGTVPDYQQRIIDYWNAVKNATAENRPEEPALYTLTEIA